METIDEIVKEMREHDNIVLWKKYITYGYTGPYFEQDVYETKLHDIADRIEKANAELLKKIQQLDAAHENDVDQVVHLLRDNIEQNKRVENLREEYVKQRNNIHLFEQENARLKAAIQPVLEVELNQVNGHPCADGDYCTSSEYGVCDNDGNEIDNESIADALSAVNEAQRIWNEGETK